MTIVPEPPAVETWSPESSMRLRLFGLLPFRGLENPKSRLGAVLDLDERRSVALDLLQRAIAAMLGAAVERLAVVTVDERLERVGLDQRVEVLLQPGNGLNAAIRQGQAWAAANGANGLMIMLPDLPLITADDVQALLAVAQVGRAVIAPDRHGTGTNALVLAPPHAIAPAFGRHSAVRHRLACALADIPVIDVERPGTHLDLDTPDDLERVEETIGDISRIPLLGGTRTTRG